MLISRCPLYLWDTLSRLTTNQLSVVPFSLRVSGAEHIEKPPTVAIDGMKKSTHWPAWKPNKGSITRGRQFVQEALHTSLGDVIYLEGDLGGMTSIESEFFDSRGEILDLTNRRQRNRFLTEAVNMRGTCTERHLRLLSYIVTTKFVHFIAPKLRLLI